MTQFDNPYANPYSAPLSQPVKTSGLAITSLVFSLIICCPVTTLLAPILGLIAFVTIGSNPMRKGRGIALAGIIIGIAVSSVWVVGGLWARDKLMHFLEVMRQGPTTALTSAFAGNAGAFRAAFHGDGATSTDAEAQLFVDTLRGRYGAFVSAEVDQNQQPATPPMGQPSISLPYNFKFEKQTVPGSVEIVIFDQRTQQWVWKIGSITIHDPAEGDITYPSTAKPGSSSSSSTGARRSPTRAPTTRSTTSTSKPSGP
jgi:hypothetical protein